MKKIKITGIIFLIILIIANLTFVAQSKYVWEQVKKENKIYLHQGKSIYEKIGLTIDNIEIIMKDKALFRKGLIDINGFFQKVMGKSVVEDVNINNTVYKMDNGQLTFNYPECKEQEILMYIDNIKALYDEVAAKGVQLIYIQAPFKNNKFDNKLPYGLNDTTNLNADRFIDSLKKNNIPYIDLRDVIKQKGFNYSNLFYNTDHHWKTETAFWAYQYVIEYLNQNFGLNYNKEMAEVSNFKKLTLKKSFLGSQANRTGRFYAGVDDFTLITPEFETNYSFKMFDGSLGLITSKTGSFEEALISKRHLSEPNKVKTIRDCSYFDINPPLAQISNHNVDDGEILIVEDSFGRPFSAFMSLQFNKTDILDLRHYKIQSLTEFIKSSEYDYIFFLYNPGIFSETGNDSIMFTFK